ncbi:MAG: hypothetical protein MJZ88_03015 [Paludibacteraceae bacterium]|nr:hypothetical protein [Paludibacteraceae bacterium]
MKKLFVLASMALLSFATYAQHVTPLNITMVEVRLDTLRTFYGEDLAALMVQLQHIDLDLKGNEDALKLARKQFNEEKSYSKCISDYVKEASKVLKTIEKDRNDELKELSGLQAIIDKQTTTAHKLTLITHDSKPKFVEHMKKERGEIDTQIKSIREQLVSLGKQQAQLKKIQDGLEIFNTEITNKDNDLKLKEGQFKSTSEAVKAEIKNTKTALKAAKKQ